jgi:hypothetical protein
MKFMAPVASPAMKEKSYHILAHGALKKQTRGEIIQLAWNTTDAMFSQSWICIWCLELRHTTGYHNIAALARLFIAASHLIVTTKFDGLLLWRPNKFVNTMRNFSQPY